MNKFNSKKLFFIFIFSKTPLKTQECIKYNYNDGLNLTNLTNLINYV
jgi:hypothetical protein